MRIKKVILDYSGFKDDELNTLAGRVLDCLNGHSTFTELPVTLAVLEDLTTDFRVKWQKASGGGSLLEIAEKNDAKLLLAGALKEIAFYVNKLASGSRSLLLSSGLQLEADPKSSMAPDRISGVAFKDGKQRNQLRVLFEPLKGEHLYEYEIADSLGEGGEPIWSQSFQTSSSRGNVFAPTIPDRTYYLRVRGRNKKGIGDWSEIASLKTR